MAQKKFIHLFPHHPVEPRRCHAGCKAKLKNNASLFECFPYVCPEPVLVKRSHLYIDGSKRLPFSLTCRSHAGAASTSRRRRRGRSGSGGRRRPLRELLACWEAVRCLPRVGAVTSQLLLRCGVLIHRQKARPHVGDRERGSGPVLVPAPANVSMTTCQIQTGWSPHSQRSFER